MVRVYSQPGHGGSLGGIFDGGHQVVLSVAIVSYIRSFNLLDVLTAYFLCFANCLCISIQPILHKTAASLTFVQRQCFPPQSPSQQPACMMMPPLAPVTPRARLSSSSSSTSPSPSPSRPPTDLRASVQLGLCRSCKRFYRKPEVWSRYA